MVGSLVHPIDKVKSGTRNARPTRIFLAHVFVKANVNAVC